MPESNMMKEYVKRRSSRRLFYFLGANGFIIIVLIFFMGMIAIVAGGSGDDGAYVGDSEDVTFNSEYTESLPIYKEIKGTGPFTDEIVQYAVGAAVKYQLLPSVILSQYGYESEYGRSLSAENDTNFFGITWFSGSGFPKGTARGIGGSEGGWYMKFPNAKASFSYYGFMVATQSNFNQSVANKSPGECLLILGRGGYAAAGITEDSTYYKSAMGIIDTYTLTSYDEFAIKRWGDSSIGSNETIGGEWANPFPGTSLDKSSFSGGQIFGTHPGGEGRPNGFHDGLDFGSIDHAGAGVHAVHAGKVIYVGNPGIDGLGTCVIVISDGGLNMVYQEFASGVSNSKVKKGEIIKAGQLIGIRDTDHLHLGFTRMDWLQAQGHAWSDDGTWIDPLLYLSQVKN